MEPLKDQVGTDPLYVMLVCMMDLNSQSALHKKVANPVREGRYYCGQLLVCVVGDGVGNSSTLVLFKWSYKASKPHWVNCSICWECLDNCLPQSSTAPESLRCG